jgi:hypothetical protein
MAARNTKFLLMANPPKVTKNSSEAGTDRGSPHAAERHQKRVGRSGVGPRPSFLDLFKKRLPTEDGRLGREVGSENLPIK